MPEGFTGLIRGEPLIADDPTPQPFPGSGSMSSVRPLLSWQRIRIAGYSMTPTLLPGDLVLVRHGARVRPGAIVLVGFRGQPEPLVVKRAVRPEAGGWLLASDNARAGSDSRQHGVAEVAAVA